MQTNIVEVLMAIHKHPTLGKLSWENDGGVHHIKRDGKSVFSGTHAEVAQRWASVKKKFNECLDTDIVLDHLYEACMDGGSTLIQEEVSAIEFVAEVLDASAPVEEWIDDFVNSNDPRFEGKSEDKRREMAIAAFMNLQKDSYDGLMESMSQDVKSHLAPHLKKFKAGNMDADTLGDHCVKIAGMLAKKHNAAHKDAQKAVNAHVDSQLGESELQERSTASLDRASEIAWHSQAAPVKHPQHAGTAINNVNRAHPSAGPRKSSFAVMHHDGQGWKVSKHERIETAAREFSKHASNPAVKVKIVNHEGNVIHATHESELTNDELQLLEQECSSMT